MGEILHLNIKCWGLLIYVIAMNASVLFRLYVY